MALIGSMSSMAAAPDDLQGLPDLPFLLDDRPAPMVLDTSGLLRESPPLALLDGNGRISSLAQAASSYVSLVASGQLPQRGFDEHFLSPLKPPRPSPSQEDALGVDVQLNEIDHFVTSFAEGTASYLAPVRSFRSFGDELLLTDARLLFPGAFHDLSKQASGGKAQTLTLFQLHERDGPFLDGFSSADPFVSIADGFSANSLLGQAVVSPDELLLLRDRLPLGERAGQDLGAVMGMPARWDGGEPILISQNADTKKPYARSSLAVDWRLPSTSMLSVPASLLYTNFGETFDNSKQARTVRDPHLLPLRYEDLDLTVPQLAGLPSVTFGASSFHHSSHPSNGVGWTDADAPNFAPAFQTPGTARADNVGRVDTFNDFLDMAPGGLVPSSAFASTQGDTRSLISFPLNVEYDSEALQALTAQFRTMASDKARPRILDPADHMGDARLPFALPPYSYPLELNTQSLAGPSYSSFPQELAFQAKQLRSPRPHELHDQWQGTPTPLNFNAAGDDSEGNPSDSIGGVTLSVF
eukprot:3006788-Pleurochrysis_carterae.AAC.1